MKVSIWLAAATVIFVVGGSAKAQLPFPLPDKGTKEFSVSGNVNFDSSNAWQVNGRYAPFLSRNLQWGLDARLLDGPGISTSGTIGVLGNYYFRGGGEPTSPLLPYVGLGIGTTFGDLDGSLWDAHFGVKYFLNASVAPFLELQFINYSSDTQNDSTQLNLGISVFLH